MFVRTLGFLRAAYPHQRKKHNRTTLLGTALRQTYVIAFKTLVFVRRQRRWRNTGLCCARQHANAKSKKSKGSPTSLPSPPHVPVIQQGKRSKALGRRRLEGKRQPKNRVHASWNNLIFPRPLGDNTRLYRCQPFCRIRLHLFHLPSLSARRRALHDVERRSLHIQPPLLS